jgi:hypothetical protein
VSTSSGHGMEGVRHDHPNMEERRRRPFLNRGFSECLTHLRVDDSRRPPAPPPDYIELPWLFLADWPLDKITAGTVTPTLAVGTVDNQVG